MFSNANDSSPQVSCHGGSRWAGSPLSPPDPLETRACPTLAPTAPAHGCIYTLPTARPLPGSPARLTCPSYSQLNFGQRDTPEAQTLNRGIILNSPPLAHLPGDQLNFGALKRDRKKSEEKYAKGRKENGRAGEARPARMHFLGKRRFGGGRRNNPTTEQTGSRYRLFRPQRDQGLRRFKTSAF